MKRALGALVLLLLPALPARGLETPEELLKQAYQLDSKGDVAKVAEAYREFLKKYPDHTQVIQVHYRLSKALENLGLFEEAIAHLQAVTQPDRKGFRERPDAFFMLGKIQASLKNYPAAIQALEALLGEGAGLHEDEALNLCGTYYALTGKYDDAASKFNILKLKQDSPLAEQAAYKLAQLWLRAEKTDLAVGAIEEMANRYPNHPRLPELLVQLADSFRKQKQHEKAIAVAEQLKSRYPKSIEAQAGRFILGLCYRDQKEFKKAVEVLAPLARVPEFQKQGLAAQATVACADICFSELNDVPKAMEYYEETTRLARDSECDIKNEILEQCYFRLAEWHFAAKRYSAALDYYVFLRALGTKLNILSRIMTCQMELDPTGQGRQYTQDDIEAIKKKIAENPGTLLALESEVFLADRKVGEASRSHRQYYAVIPDYEAILKKYPKDLLAQDHYESYVNFQLGLCHSEGQTVQDYVNAVRRFEQALGVDAQTPYLIPILEHIAVYAEKAGDKKRTMEAFEKLYMLTSEAAGPDKKDVKTDSSRSLDYLRALTTRASTEDLIQKTVDMLKKIIADKGPLSEEAREARFYLGELYFVKRDFAASARAYKEFIQVYGPKLDANGNVVDPPWRPKSVDNKTLQVYEAATRIAHCWYMQAHSQNMIQAYDWILKNLSYQNPYLAEAYYYLAMELAKGDAGQSKEGKRKLADTLWKTVVHPSLDFDAPNYAKQYHPWVLRDSAGHARARQFVRTAMLRAGQTYAELGEHALAAGCFEQFLIRFPLGPGGGPRKDGREVRPGARREPQEMDEMAVGATYLLGREYIALGDTAKAIECYKPFLTGLRDSRLRVSALKLLAYHCGKSGKVDDAMEVYATLLDEYGKNAADSKGNPIPLPRKDRLRQGQTNWDGLRLPPPSDLDLGEIRYNLGYFFFKQQDWERGVVALAPFRDEAALRNSRHRDRALYMLAQSHFKRQEYAGGAQALQTLMREHPKFEALEEAYTYAARGYAEVRQWTELDMVYRRFVAEWPKSDYRPRMDYYNALSLLNQGKPDGIRTLRSMTDGDLFDDVRADAAWQAGAYYAAANPPNLQEAYRYLDKSVELYAREQACLELGKVCIKLRKWDRAQSVLQRLLREFPYGDRKYLGEAERLLPEVQRELARDKTK